LWEDPPPGDALKRYTVCIPSKNKTLFRAVIGTSPEALVESFKSGAEQGRERYRDEDTAEYRAISAFDRRENAVAQAHVLNPVLAQKERPLLTHVAAFKLNAKARDAYAITDPDGHHLTWGNAEKLARRAFDIAPI
jgi:hypothetical protein